MVGADNKQNSRRFGMALALLMLVYVAAVIVFIIAY